MSPYRLTLRETLPPQSPSAVCIVNHLNGGTEESPFLLDPERFVDAAVFTVDLNRDFVRQHAQYRDFVLHYPDCPEPRVIRVSSIQPAGAAGRGGAAIAAGGTGRTVAGFMAGLSTNDPVPPADEIIETLRDRAAQILKAALGSATLDAFEVSGPGNFPYYWEDPRNLDFNASTYAWIDRALKPNTDPLQLDGSFKSVFLDAISKVAYTLSKADQAALNTAMKDAVDQQGAILSNWKKQFGSLPSGDGQPIDLIVDEVTLKWANPPTDLEAMQRSTDLNKLLNKTPASGKPLLPLFSNWLNALGAAVPLVNATTQNNAFVQQSKEGVLSPQDANNALTLNDGTLVPRYRVTTPVADILNGLKNTDAHIGLSMSVKRTTSSEYRVSISGQGSFDIPIAGLLGINVGASASYFQEEMATTSNEVEVSMEFTGVTLVNFEPAEYQVGQGQNWYYAKPIRDAVANGASDVSGYKFSPTPQIDFGKNGGFRFLEGVAISNYPSMTITVRGSNYQSVATTFEQSASVGVSFLGIPLGLGGSESTYSSNTQVDSSKSEVTIRLSPPAELVAGAAVDSLGWVLGAVQEVPVG